MSHLLLRDGIQSEPDCMTLLVAEQDQPHIRLPPKAATPLSRLRRAWAQEDGTILGERHFKPSCHAVRLPASVRTDQVLGIFE